MTSRIEAGDISVQIFKNNLLSIFDETFDNVQGAYLDSGDAFFPTLEAITSKQASIPVCGDRNSIASQVNHVIFYFDVAFQYMQGENPGRQDWSKAWELVSVSDDEWRLLKDQLRDRQQKLFGLINETPASAFTHEETVGGAMAAIAHTAFHLGQIRHALCFTQEHNG